MYEPRTLHKWVTLNLHFYPYNSLAFHREKYINPFTVSGLYRGENRHATFASWSLREASWQKHIYTITMWLSLGILGFLILLNPNLTSNSDNIKWRIKVLKNIWISIERAILSFSRSWIWIYYWIFIKSFIQSPRSSRSTRKYQFLSNIHILPNFDFPYWTHHVYSRTCGIRFGSNDPKNLYNKTFMRFWKLYFNTILGGDVSLSPE